MEPSLIIIILLCVFAVALVVFQIVIPEYVDGKIVRGLESKCETGTVWNNALKLADNPYAVVRKVVILDTKRDSKGNLHVLVGGQCGERNYQEDYDFRQFVLTFQYRPEN